MNWILRRILSRVIRGIIIANILSLFLSSSVFAATENKKQNIPTSSISLTPVIGGYLFAGSESLNPTILYGLKLSYDMIGVGISDTLGVEGTFDYFSTTTKSGSKKVDGALFRVDAIYSVTPRNKLVPFLAVGIGDILVNKDSTLDNSPLLNYGIGLKYYLQDYLAVRADVRHLFVYNSVSTRNNFELSMGLTYVFGKERKKTPAQPPVVPPKPVPVVVEPVLTPAPVPTPAPAPVPTPAPEPVIETAPLPIPAVESPPAPVAPVEPTPVSAPVQAQKKAVVTLDRNLMRNESIEFEFAKTVMDSSYDDSLKATAALINSSPNATIRIEGHTDSIGSSAANLSLSVKRAISFKNGLVKLGVDPGKVTIKGYGFAKPIANNSTEEGRKKNRRAVAVIVIKQKK
ncbi:MAG: OmpA family protein [Desulfuromonadales bacterium]|nr:OmpA family protein [Desulfuromonadales bacterium]